MRFIMGILSVLFGMGMAQNVYANSEGFVVMDVRTADEFKESHVKDAINIDIRERSFKDQLSKLDKNKIYKVYCRSGNRSGQAERIMKEMGFKDVENIGGLGQAARRLNRTCEGKTC